MKRLAMMALVISVMVLVSGCADPKKPAEAALAQAVTEWNAIKQQVLDVMPEEAPAIEDAIEDATQKLAAKDFKAALVTATALGANVKRVAELLEGRASELQAQWKEISATMPASIAKLEQKLRGFKLPAAGSPGAENSPQAQFAKLKADWDSAQSAMLGGHLADAVARGTAVRDLAVKLLTDMQDGS